MYKVVLTLPTSSGKEKIEKFISNFKIFFLGDMQKIRGLELKKESWDFFRLSN
ncbi:hypothetical protein [Lactobacillus sp. UCMA15818]|uniref:hypothetical protein n=1 Tax=Lactobacillus sp. UCMA15818 TaxID=2583394 RepID=UPI0025B08F71|nr:hypothetical protein [Lactobacillus sp. UCMA15818]